MTRKRSSPLGLEELLSLAVLLLVLPALAQAAPLQEYTEIQQYPEGCYYNYAHYNEGDRIMTNEPCLNCTCHNRMLMCYLRVCPFTKPIGHDCIVEKREDQCCPIITCPEVPVNVPYHTPEPGTELSIPEKFGCSIEEKFYPEGAQVPSNPNKPCELCYCINNQTKCVMQECTLHVDGCTPIYNKGSCCPVRYSCDHENDVLELEDLSTTTTTVRPTPGFILTTTMTPSVSTDCVHNGDEYADGASISGKNACEHCYCMRGDIVCAVQECEIPMSTASGKVCRAMPAPEGECCPSNYVCEDDSATTEIVEVTTQEFRADEGAITTAVPVKDIHGEIPKEDVDLQEHIDDNEQDMDIATESPVSSGEVDEQHTTVASEEKDKKSEKKPSVPSIATDSRIDTPTESSTEASEEEGSGEVDAIKPTTPRVQDVSHPAEPAKDISDEEDIVKTTTPSVEGSGEIEDIAASTASPSKETSDESEEDIIKPTTASVESTEESKKTTTPASATEKTPSKEDIGVEDAVKATTPAGEDTDKEDVLRETTSAPSNEADVTKTTTPAKESGEEDEVIEATTPSKGLFDEEEVVKATTPSKDLTGEEEDIKATTPSKETSEEKDVDKATTPSKDITSEGEVVKETTPSTETTDEEDAIKPTIPSKDITSEEETVKATTPSKEITDEEEIIKATTSSTEITDEKDAIKPTIPSDDITSEDEDVKATTPSKKIADEEEVVKATTPSTDLTGEEEDIKPTTPSKETSEEKDVVKATTPSKDITSEGEVVKTTTPSTEITDEEDAIKPTIPSKDITSDEEAVKATTPSKEITDEEEVVKATTPSTEITDEDDAVRPTIPSKDITAEEEVIRATTPSKDISDEEEGIQTTTPSKKLIEDSEEYTIKPSISAEDDSVDEDIKKDTTPSEDITDEKEITQSTTPSKKVSDDEEIYPSSTTIPAEGSEAEDAIKTTTPASEKPVDQDTDKATTEKSVTGEELTTAPTKESSSEQDKEGLKPTEQTSDEKEIVSETTAADDTIDEEVTSRAPTPIKHDQPEDEVKSTTTKPVEEQTESAESSTDTSSQKDKLSTTSAPHIPSSTTEGISSQDSTESTSEEEKPQAEITTAVPTFIGDRKDEPTTESEEKESDEEKADKGQTEIPEKDDSESSTEKATSTEAIDEKEPIDTEKKTVSSTVTPLGKPEQPADGAETGTEPQTTVESTTQAVPAKSDIVPADVKPDHGTEQPETSEESSTDRPPAVYLPPAEKDETSTNIPETSDESVTASSTEDELEVPAKVTPVDTHTEFAPKKTTLAPITEEETTSAELPDMHLPSIIPGEGDCLVEGKTYANNTNVPATTPCDISCKCVSSIVSCKPMECKIPEDREKCVLATDLLDGCCPTYICETDSSTAKTSDATEEDKSTTVKPEASKKPVDRFDEEESTSTEEIPKDVIMPSGITEQPLSHVKPDEEIVTTDIPILVDITPSTDVKKPASEESTSEEDDNEVEPATAAPEIKKETQKPADKEPSFEEDTQKQTDDDSTKPTTDKASEKPSKDQTTTPSTEDKTQKETEDKLAATTISPISEKDEKPSKAEPGHEKVKEPETDDKTLATTISPLSDEISTESSGEEPSSTAAHEDSSVKKPAADVEKMPSSTEAEVTDRITTLAPTIDASKPSDEKTDEDESTEDSVNETTPSETEKDHDKKKLFVEIPLPTTVLPITETDDDINKPADKDTSSQPEGEDSSEDTATKAPSTDVEVPTSIPVHKKDQDETTKKPVAVEKEEDSSTEEDSTPSEADEQATTVSTVDKVSKHPEDVFESVPTTLAPSTQDETKKPSKEEPESPASSENEIEPELEPTTTASSTPADKETGEQSIPVTTSESDKDSFGPTTITPSEEKIPSTSDGKLDKEPFTTVAPIADISKKPEDEKVSAESSSTEAEIESGSETPTLVSSTPSDRKDTEDSVVPVTDSVPAVDDESSTEKSDELEEIQPTSQPEKGTVTTSAPSAEDDKRKSPTTDDVSPGTTAAPTSEEDIKETSDEETTSSSLEMEEDAKPAFTTSPSVADKEKPSIEISSTPTPVEDEDEVKMDVTTIISTSEAEKPKDEKKPTDTSDYIPSTDSPALEDVSTESIQDKFPSSTTQSSVEKVTETTTGTRTDADSGDSDQITTVAPSSEEPSSKPFDETVPSSTEDADSDKITTAAPSSEEPATDDKKSPPLPTTPSSVVAEHDDKKPTSAENEIEHKPVTDIESTTQVPSSEEESDSIPTKAPVADDKSESTTVLPAEEQSTEGDKHKPDESTDSSTESQPEKSDKPSEKEPTLPTVLPPKDSDKGEESETTTEHLFEDAAKKIPTFPLTNEKVDYSTTSTAAPIKTETETSVDDKIDASTSSPIEDDDSGESTSHPVSDKTEGEDINAPTTESEKDQEVATVTSTSKTPIDIDTTTTPSPIHVPGAEEIDTKPIEDVMSQTIAPESEEDKTPIETSEPSTTSAEDADKTPVTVAPVAQDIEASSEDSKKPSQAGQVDEETTEGAIIEQDNTTEQTADDKLKPVTSPTAAIIPTRAPVQEAELEKETAKPGTDKEVPESSSEVPDSELHTVKPIDIEKSTVAPTVVPGLDSGEEGGDSGESEEDHTTASEDSHKEGESDESTESEQSVTEGVKKPEHDEIEVPAVVSELPQTTVTEASTEVSSEDNATEQPDIANATPIHPLFAQHFTSTTKAPSIHDRLGEGETDAVPTVLPTERTTTEAAPATTTTAASSGHHEPITPPSYGQQPQYPSYPEDDYEDEDVFGPGTCRYAGKIYVSAQQIPRDDPCDFCFCFRSDIICLQQSCPPPIAGCHEEPISGFCCPRYECPVSMAAVLNITTSTTTTSTTLPPHFLNYSHGDAVQHTGCLINGRSYKVGEPIESTSGPCISCTCGGDGKMKCNPQQCVPEPTMQQVLASYASARKR